MKGRASHPPMQAKLALVPPELAEAIREATIDEDLGRLYELIDGVAQHDAEVAEYLRSLLEDVAYGALEDLFDEHIDGLGWHGFRRKLADDLRDAPLKDLADLGGWKTPRTILEVYQGSDLDSMRQAQQRRRAVSDAAASGE